MQTSTLSNEANAQRRPPLSEGWLKHLQAVFESEDMLSLRRFLQGRYQAGAKIYPAKGDYFRALNLTDFNDVRVVILGQDPYHGPGQAQGLSFSVPPGIDKPPSLRNIFQELKNDLGLEIANSGNLEKWAREGVLLLNSVLTVEEGQPASHQGRGWEVLTDSIIKSLSENRTGIVFLLWGAHAQKKSDLIEGQKHLILKAPHPSPLSCHRGFFGSKPFSNANQFLIRIGQKPINWNLNN